VTSEEVIAFIRSHSVNGIAPKREIVSGSVKWGAYKHFGGWLKACAAAGVIPYRQAFPRRRKKEPVAIQEVDKDKVKTLCYFLYLARETHKNTGIDLRKAVDGAFKAARLQISGCK